MKRWLVIGLWFALAGCEGGSLPVDPTDPLTRPGPGPQPEGGGGGGGGDGQPARQSLWPLTPGSTWTYRITDPLRGGFDKQVTVEGPQAMPGGITAIAVRSVQPYLEELSWQQEADGVVYRLREEDSRDGALVRRTTWTPATLKALSAPQTTGWTSSVQVREVVQLADGSIKDEKDKTFVWRVLATDEEVTTPAGTFRALKVARERPDKTGSERTYWLVPGVGKVREDGERLEELLRYDVRR